MRKCPNCGQKTGGYYCQWCGYPIIADDKGKGVKPREDDSALAVALRLAAEKREAQEKAGREAEEKAKREAQEGEASC